MKVTCYKLGNLQTNCFLLVEDKSCMLIDPSDDASFLLEEISRQNLTLRALLATHGHFDHVMAVGELQLNYPLPFYIHKNDSFLMKRLPETAKYFLGYVPHIIPPQKISYFDGSSSIQIENFKFQIIFTPGHTPGSVSYYFPSEEAVFTGDTLFKESIGRTDLSYSSKSDLKQSLKKLFALPEQTTVYPGHGEETYIIDEKRIITGL